MFSYPSHWEMESNFIPLECGLALVTCLTTKCSGNEILELLKLSQKKPYIFCPGLSGDPCLLSKIADYSKTTVLQRPHIGAAVSCPVEPILLAISSKIPEM